MFFYQTQVIFFSKTFWLFYDSENLVILILNSFNASFLMESRVELVYLVLEKGVSVDKENYYV